MNSKISISVPCGIIDWLKLLRLYFAAFPRAERKPFSRIYNMYRRGKSDIWCICRGGVFAGFATTVNSPDVILLDYLAISSDHRGEGIGSAAMELFKDKYKGKGFFVEIESPFEDCPDKEARKKRREFYIHSGMEPMNVMAEVFGVKMELLGIGCLFDFEGYKAFYRDHYSEWASEHVLYEKHPDEES